MRGADSAPTGARFRPIARRTEKGRRLAPPAFPCSRFSPRSELRDKARHRAEAVRVAIGVDFEPDADVVHFLARRREFGADAVDHLAVIAAIRAEGVEIDPAIADLAVKQASIPRANAEAPRSEE